MFNINPGKSPLKIIPLGGVGNVTKNMYVYEYDNEIIVVDCGVGFPDEAMPGIDLVIPDVSYLRTKKNQIKGILLTHGHDDHIGALPYIIKDFMEVPIFGSRLTAALVEAKFREFGINKKVEILENGGSLSLGKYKVEWAHITHSIPQALNYIITTPIGVVYHGSDFKFDWTPVDENPPEVGKIAMAGQKGILCLLSDCLGAERKGATLSEKVVEETLEREIFDCTGKFIVTTQSSNISRLRQAIEVGLRHNRQIAVVGKSMESNIDVAQKLGFINLPKGRVIRTEDVPKFPGNELLLLVSGSQGQESSALTRVASGEHQSVKIEPGDVVVFSSDPIPGNENDVYRLIDNLAQLGARVSYTDVRDELHVSGHGSSYDLMLLLSLTKPKFVFPIGGTPRHMQQYGLIAKKLGYQANQIILGTNGQTLELTPGTANLTTNIEIKNIMIDGLGVGDVGNIVLRDRIVMSADGIVVVIIPLEQNTGKLSGEPDVISRGFVYMKEAEKLIEEAKNVVKNSVSSHKERIVEWHFIKKRVEEDLGKFFFKKTKRRPMIVAVIIEV